ncbi:MAG: hypothetical protein EBR28_04165 [Planctomycetia bacterium]|nr:hypothetical protein [Planctomycetia bacterium]
MTLAAWWYPVVAWGAVFAALVRLAPLSRRLPAWAPAAVAAATLVPIAGLPLGRWLHGIGLVVSLPLLVVFVDAACTPAGGGGFLGAAGRRAAVWFGAVAGIVLYPAALGLGAFDPYVLGWRTPGVAAAVAVIGVGLALAGNRFSIAILAAGVAWQAGILESDNAWDYVVDPLYTLLAAANLAGMGLASLARRAGPLRAASVSTVCAVLAGAAAGADPPQPRTTLDERFEASLAELERRATRGGFEDIASLVREWHLPAVPGRQSIRRIPPRLTVPESIDTPEEELLWADFVAARRARAAGLFALAVEAARAHARVPSRTERARGDGPKPLEQRGCEAIELLYAALRDDPEHERARKAGGWVRRDDGWVWPETARRLDAGEIRDAARGWTTRSRLGRDEPTPPGATIAWLSDHWKISSRAGRNAAATLAQELELAHDVWRQAFGGFVLEPAELERAFEGRGRPPSRGPFAATLFADRAAYAAELEKFEPTIARTLGLYWTPTRTAYFLPATGGDDAFATATVHHEAVHQLFAEMRKTSPLAGERFGFWAIEASACYLESLQPAADGWTLGGRDAGRAPAARERLVEDGFHVPLGELCAFGRSDLQADERLPAIYSQISGLADFFMNGEQGKYREAFVEYLVRIYTGTVSPDTLARLCGTTYADLDDAYRRHMAR